MPFHASAVDPALLNLLGQAAHLQCTVHHSRVECGPTWRPSSHGVAAPALMFNTVSALVTVMAWGSVQYRRSIQQNTDTGAGVCRVLSAGCWPDRSLVLQSRPRLLPRLLLHLQHLPVRKPLHCYTAHYCTPSLLQYRCQNNKGASIA